MKGRQSVAYSIQSYWSNIIRVLLIYRIYNKMPTVWTALYKKKETIQLQYKSIQEGLEGPAHESLQSTIDYSVKTHHVIGGGRS